MVAGFLHRQYPIIVFSFVLMMALGVVYLFTTPPSFTAQAKMLIDTRKVQLLQQQSILADVPPNSAVIDSQVEVLQSENIALAVIKNLGLTEDPEFTGPSGGLIAAVVGFVSGLFASPGGPPSEFGLTRAAIGRFQAQLSVKRAGLTYIINIDFRSRNAERAAQIANAVADAYVVDQLEAKYEATRRAGKWLQDRIRDLREQATTAERAVLDFKEKNNIVDYRRPFDERAAACRTQQRARPGSCADGRGESPNSSGSTTLSAWKCRTRRLPTRCVMRSSRSYDRRISNLDGRKLTFPCAMDAHISRRSTYATR